MERLKTGGHGSLSLRTLKKKILNFLRAADFDESLKKICTLPARQAVNPLFSLFYDTDERVRWRAISAMGAVVSNLAESDMESARIIMRRLMWNLNDESGGIGWGSPESMGEIMARHQQMAREYALILVSYIDKKGNFIEHEILQRGVLWGLGRLAYARPCMISTIVPLLLPFMQSEDAYHRGLAVWASGAFDVGSVETQLRRLTTDDAKITLFRNNHLTEPTVAELAEEVLFKAGKKYEPPTTSDE